MRRRGSAILFSFAVIVGVGIAIVLFRPADGGPYAQPSAEPKRDWEHGMTAPVSQTLAATVQASASQVQQAVAKPPAASGMLQRFNGATSYRAFIEDALRHPELGGLHWAMFAMGQCMRARPALEAARAGSRERQAAAAQMVARCDIDQEETQRQLNAVLQNGVAVTQDPGFALMSEPRKGDRARLRTAERLVLGGDVIDQSNLIRLGAEGGGPGHEDSRYFNGTWYDTPAEVALIEDAWSIAMCRLGMDCGLESLPALEICVERGACANDLPSALLAAREHDDSAAQVAQLAEDLVRAIRDGKPGAFVRQR